MPIKDRYPIVPQMEDYDKLTSDWKPYLMYFHHPCVTMKSMSTDQHGFRHSMAKNGAAMLSFEDFLKLEKYQSGIILGASTAFGVGASSNNTTIPSLLNACTDKQWFNFGGRAYNSTQEMILFLMFAPFHIGKLIIFSGLNNFILPFLTSSSGASLPPFYFQSRFEKGMTLEVDEVLGIKYRAKQLAHEVRHKLLGKNKYEKKTASKVNLADMLSAFERDMKVLTSISHDRHFDIHFFFQPFACWIDKTFTKEELQLFSILDHCSTLDWGSFTRQRETEGKIYVNAVSQACAKYSVPFFDMNEAQEFKNDDWLFVDRVHLTDLGNDRVVNIIKREIKL